MEVLFSGKGEFIPPDPEGMREWIRTNKNRALVSKLMDEHEAVARFVNDGDYLSYDLFSLSRGPNSLIREIVRQRKKKLWLGAKFTWFETTILVAAGCCTKIDVGFIGAGRSLMKAIESGKVQTTEWTNHQITLRHLAGAMGIPFIPTTGGLGTDTLEYSGAKVVKDPFTGRKISLLPAINPDVAMVHVNQCDVYGNARVFGPSPAPLETAMSAKKLIISTEEIIDIDDIRRNPGMTLIPYYFVDAVVYAPYGAYPGTVPGLYRMDSEHMNECLTASNEDRMDEYLEKYFYSVKSHEEFLEKRVGPQKLVKLRADETIKEGYYS